MSTDEFKPADEHPHNRLRIAQAQHIIACPACEARFSDRLPKCPECGEPRPFASAKVVKGEIFWEEDSDEAAV